MHPQFESGMTWDNSGKGGWVVGHVIPLSSARDEHEVIRLCHYTNLQPLWWDENLRKGNRSIFVDNSIEAIGNKLKEAV